MLIRKLIQASKYFANFANDIHRLIRCLYHKVFIYSIKLVMDFVDIIGL